MSKEISKWQKDSNANLPKIVSSPFVSLGTHSPTFRIGSDGMFEKAAPKGEMNCFGEADAVSQILYFL